MSDMVKYTPTPSAPTVDKRVFFQDLRGSGFVLSVNPDGHLALAAHLSDEEIEDGEYEDAISSERSSPVLNARLAGCIGRILMAFERDGELPDEKFCRSAWAEAGLNYERDPYPEHG